MNRSTLWLLVALAPGCAWDEGLTIENMTGKVVIPKEAATRVMNTADGGTEEITDPRLIGPVYLGFYSEVRDDVKSYPHPAVGPAIAAGQEGDTYPYGGSTVGDFRFACNSGLTCKVVSDRYTSYDDLLEWFNVRVGEPVVDPNGEEIVVGDYLRQTCMQMLQVTADDEIRILPKDRNADGYIDTSDLQFVLNADDEFEAEFTVWQQEFFRSNEGVGMSLWGWMDSPAADFTYSTCDPSNGYNQIEYSQNFFGGRQYQDVLNSPSKYIIAGDWVASEAHVYENWDDEVVLRIDFPVEN